MGRKRNIYVLDTSDVGWRIKQLRIRRGLLQSTLARRARIDPSYLSRLERGDTGNTKPKPETIRRILDAMGATADERASVYHVEEPPLSPEETANWVGRVAQHEEDSPQPVSLFDDRWFRLYQNRSARAAMALTPEEYQQVVGEHLLTGLIDPASIIYPRIAEEYRTQMFASTAAAFKLHFARQQFDRWYLEVVEKIRRVEWAAQIWDHPPESLPIRMDRHDLILDNPIVGRLRFSVQFNRLLLNPRLYIVDWTTIDKETSVRLAELLQRPEFAYSLPDTDTKPI